MNIAEYIREAKAFPFSYDCIKMEREYNELNLMSLYLDSNEFIKENSEYEYIFKEAYDDKFTDAAEKDFWYKLFQSIKKIIGWLLKPFRAIYSFLTSYFDKEEQEEKRFEKSVEALSEYIKVEAPIMHGEAFKLPDEEVSKPLLDALHDFRDKHPQLWKDVVEGKVYGSFIGKRNAHKHGWKGSDVYAWILRISKYSHLGNEEETFLHNLFPAIQIRQYEIPTFFAAIYNNRETLNAFVVSMKKTFSKERVKKPIFVAEDIALLTDMLEDEFKKKTTYLLPLKKAQELGNIFKSIVKGIEEVYSLVDKFISNPENLVENTEKQKEGFMSLLNEIKKLLKLMQNHNPHAINKLLTHKNNIYAMQNFWNKITPLIKAVEENVTKNKVVDNLGNDDSKI